MKKSDLFPILDHHNQRLMQAKAIGRLIMLASDQPECTKKDLCDSVSVVCDLLEELDTTKKTISRAVSEIYFLDNAVHGEHE